MAIFGSHHKRSASKSNNNNNNNSSPLSFSSLTPTSSSKSLQNVSLSNSNSSPSHHHQNNIKLAITIESPPIVLYGNPKDSSGSLLSGLLKLEILNNVKQLTGTNTSNLPLTLMRSNPTSSSSNDIVVIQSVQLYLSQSIQYGKPFVPPSNTLQSCSDCKFKQTELARWDVLTEPTDFIRGTEHGYPFSHLIPGALPQTTLLSNLNTIINYELIAKVVLNKGKKSDEVIKLSLPIIVKRSILRGPDRNSLRIFPPTEVTASLVLPSVLYPKSSFPIELKMENVCSSERRWRLRKLNWRLEENIKVKLNSCDSHKFKLKVIEDHTRKLNQQQNQIPKKKSLLAPQVTSTFEPPPPPQPVDLIPQTSNTGISPVQTQTQTQDQRSLRNGLDELLDNDAPQRPILNDSTNNLGNESPVVETEDQVIPEAPKQHHALYLEETRTISHGEIKSGWKSDFSNKGRIELVAEIDLANLTTVGLSSSLNLLHSIDSSNSSSPHYNIKNLLNNVSSNCACDIYDDTLGVYVSHLLIVELVVAEELLQGSNLSANQLKPSKSKDNRLAEVSVLFANNNSTPKPVTSSNSSSTKDASGKPSSPENKVGIPTGAARVLRMQFKVVLTERSGLGIAWDDEVPPTYQDIRLLSPPTYDQTLNVSHLNNSDQTPSLDLLSYPEPAAVSQSHRTPGVIYGGGDTPGASFSNVDLNGANSAELNEFQELRL